MTLSSDYPGGEFSITTGFHPFPHLADLKMVEILEKFDIKLDPPCHEIQYYPLIINWPGYRYDGLIHWAACWRREGQKMEAT